MPTRALLLGLCSVAAFGGAAVDNRIGAAVGGGAGPTHVRTVAELLAEWGALEPQLEPQPQQGLQDSPMAPDAELLTAALGIAPIALSDDSDYGYILRLFATLVAFLCLVVWRTLWRLTSTGLPHAGAGPTL